MGYTLLQFFFRSSIPNMRFKYLLSTIQGVSVSISSHVFMFLDISISTRTTTQPIRPNVLFSPEQCPVFCLNVSLCEIDFNWWQNVVSCVYRFRVPKWRVCEDVVPMVYRILHTYIHTDPHTSRTVSAVYPTPMHTASAHTPIGCPALPVYSMCA